MYDEFFLQTRAFGWMEVLPTPMDWFEKIIFPTILLTQLGVPKQVT